MQDSTPTAPVNRAARRAAKRGKSMTGENPSHAPQRDGRAHTKPVHARTDFAARRSG